MSTTPAGCFHCGEALPAGRTRHVRIDGTDRPVCCPGCEAVAGLIADAGLADFYRYRAGPAPTPPEATPDEWDAFDRDAVQARFVRDLGDQRREAVLVVEGLYCAACAWLIEHVLGSLPGLEAVEVNPASGRALLRWRADRTALSTLLRRIAAAGYRPRPVGADEGESRLARERGAALRRLAVAGLGMMQVMMYAVGLYAGAIHAGMDPAITEFLRLVSLLVATPVVLYAGRPFFSGAWRDLRAGRPGMDVPVALAIGGAFAASVWNTLAGHGEVYFDSVTMFVFFLSLARFFEMGARHRAGRATRALARTLPATALRIGAGGAERVALHELAVGDRVRVRAGDTVPADGRIVTGEGRLDESLLTGEFMPVARGPGGDVTGGSVNAGGPIDVEVTRVGQETLVAGIVRMLERAQAQRPALARTADRVARWFVAGVLAAAGTTALYWGLVAPGEAFAITLAVLVVTCPCALSLATPSALVAATGRLAQRGLLVARTGALEDLARADYVVVDKTGTLTRGELVIRRVEPTGRIDAQRALALAAALEARSEHPIARAFATGSTIPDATAVRVERGHGVEGRVDGRHLRLGRPDWAGDPCADDGAGTETVVALADADGLLARFRLADSVRPGVPAALAALQRLGLEIEVVSGDASGAVAALAADLGLRRWQARRTPADKLARVRALQAAGHRVIMVGDGINDAPVLAGANASVAMGNGAALAQTHADMVLARGRLGDLGEGIGHARETLRVIRQNLAWAVGYNLLALPLAAAGYVPPWMAALGMSASSLLVVGNAMRLGAKRRSRTAGEPAPMVAATGHG